MQEVLAAVAGPATLRTIRRGAVQLVSSFFFLFKCSVALCLLLVTCLFPRGDNTAMTTLVNYKRMIFGEIGKLKVDLHLVCSSNHGGAYCKLWRSSWKDVGAATPRANVIRGCDSGVKMAPHVVFLTALSQNFLR